MALSVSKLIIPVSLTAAEATALDPQLRILLEVTYECLESGMQYHRLSKTR